MHRSRHVPVSDSLTELLTNLASVRMSVGTSTNVCPRDITASRCDSEN